MLQRVNDRWSYYGDCFVLNLRGQLLIAMPQMTDPRFERAVVFMCDHSSKGAMGLIINKPLPELRFKDLLTKLSIDTEGAPIIPIHFGGPVEKGRGFVLHSSDYKSGAGAARFAHGFAMSATLDVIEDIAQGRGPQQLILAIGYAGWGAGQLEGEIAQNAWLSCGATRQIVFDTDSDKRWTAAMNHLGVDPLALSPTAGRA